MLLWTYGYDFLYIYNYRNVYKDIFKGNKYIAHLENSCLNMKYIYSFFW